MLPAAGFLVFLGLLVSVLSNNEFENGDDSYYKYDIPDGSRETSYYKTHSANLEDIRQTSSSVDLAGVKDALRQILPHYKEDNTMMTTLEAPTETEDVHSDLLSRIINNIDAEKLRKSEQRTEESRKTDDISKLYDNPFTLPSSVRYHNAPPVNDYSNYHGADPYLNAGNEIRGRFKSGFLATHKYDFPQAVEITPTNRYQYRTWEPVDTKQIESLTQTATENNEEKAEKDLVSPREDKVNPMIKETEIPQEKVNVNSEVKSHSHDVTSTEIEKNEELKTETKKTYDMSHDDVRTTKQILSVQKDTFITYYDDKDDDNTIKSTVSLMQPKKEGNELISDNKHDDDDGPTREIMTKSFNYDDKVKDKIVKGFYPLMLPREEGHVPLRANKHDDYDSTTEIMTKTFKHGDKTTKSFLPLMQPRVEENEPKSANKHDDDDDNVDSTTETMTKSLNHDDEKDVKTTKSFVPIIQPRQEGNARRSDNKHDEDDYDDDDSTTETMTKSRYGFDDDDKTTTSFVSAVYQDDEDDITTTNRQTKTESINYDDEDGDINITTPLLKRQEMLENDEHYNRISTIKTSNEESSSKLLAHKSTVSEKSPLSDSTDSILQPEPVLSNSMNYRKSWSPDGNTSIIVVPLNKPENFAGSPDHNESTSLVIMLDTLFTATESIFDEKALELATEQFQLENETKVVETADNNVTTNDVTDTDSEDDTMMTLVTNSDDNPSTDMTITSTAQGKLRLESDKYNITITMHNTTMAVDKQEENIEIPKDENYLSWIDNDLEKDSDKAKGKLQSEDQEEEPKGEDTDQEKDSDNPLDKLRSEDREEEVRGEDTGLEKNSDNAVVKLRSEDKEEEPKGEDTDLVKDSDNAVVKLRSEDRQEEPRGEDTGDPSQVDPLGSIAALRRNVKKPCAKSSKRLDDVDISLLLKVIGNYSKKYSGQKLTDKINETLTKEGLPTVGVAAKTTTNMYGNLTGTIMGKCFVCGIDLEKKSIDFHIPMNSYCGDAFGGDFIPLVPVDPQARGQIFKFRKYCRWKNIQRVELDPRDSRSVLGRWTGGCSVRWIDLSGMYTERSCRNRHRATHGVSYTSKRMAKLEMALQHVDNGCIMSPVASLVPLSRAISLYARIFACVCTGNWCNLGMATHYSPGVTVLATLVLVFNNFIGAV